MQTKENWWKLEKLNVKSIVQLGQLLHEFREQNTVKYDDNYKIIKIVLDLVGDVMIKEINKTEKSFNTNKNT